MNASKLHHISHDFRSVTVTCVHWLAEHWMGDCQSKLPLGTPSIRPGWNLLSRINVLVQLRPREPSYIQDRPHSTRNEHVDNTRCRVRRAGGRKGNQVLNWEKTKAIWTTETVAAASNTMGKPWFQTDREASATRHKSKQIGVGTA